EHSNVLWIKTDDAFTSFTVKQISSVKDLEGIKIFADPNNNTFVACNTGNLNDAGGGLTNSAFPSLIKIDPDGNVLKNKNYKLPFYANMYDCIRLGDGSFVMTGTGVNESFILKVNSSLETEWLRTYPIANGNNDNVKVFENI